MSKKIEDIIQQFRKERGWDQSDTLDILAKSIVVEAAELLECFQFEPDKYNRDHVASELADVLMYTISMCIDLDLDFRQIIVDKLEDVAKRYPKCK